MAQWETREPVYREYAGFTFNGVHSSQLNLYRVSDGGRYNEDMSAAFQDKTVQAPGRDGTFYFGTNYTSRTFNIQLAFDSMTEDDMIEFRRIFAAKEEGYLIFDESAYKKYKVKIQSPPQLKYIAMDEPNEDESLYSKIIHTSDLGVEEVSGARVDTGRIYKGEGTIQFIAYDPFAIDNGRYLQNYVESIDNNKNLIQYPYVDGTRIRKNNITFIVNTGSTNTDDIGKIVVCGTSNWNGKVTYYNINNCLTLEPNTMTGSDMYNAESYTDLYYLDANLEDLNLNNKGQGHIDDDPTTPGDQSAGWAYVVLTIQKVGGKGTILYSKNNDGNLEVPLNSYNIPYRGSASNVNSKGGIFYVSGGSIDVKVYVSVRYVINQPAPAKHRMNRIGPQIKKFLKTETATTGYVSPLKAGRPDWNTYKNWVNGVKTWREGSRMKDTQLGSYPTTGGITFYNPPYDCCTFTMDSTTYPTTDPRYGKTFFRVYNAGEVDSDLMLYFDTGTSEPKSLSLYSCTKSGSIGYEVNESGEEVIVETTDTEVFDQVAVLNFNTFENAGPTDRPEIIRYNSHTNLLEGVYRDGGVDYVTGNIYNRYITSGSFFKIPAYNKNVEYYIIAESKNSTATSACMIDDIEYHHVYY